MFCEKCGKEIDNHALVCGYCGHAIPIAHLSNDTITKLKQNQRSDESLKTNHNANVRGAGYVLMGLGGVCDLAGIAMVGSGSVEGFSAILIVGSILFGLGMLLAFAFH